MLSALKSTLSQPKVGCLRRKRIITDALVVAPHRQLVIQAIRKHHVSSLASCVQSQRSNNHNTQMECHSLLTVCSAALISANVITQSATLESSQTRTGDTNETSMLESAELRKEDAEEEEEDPYENLPEEDEPTECSMCNTFRQGPCRPYWRKLERCFKDHEGEENGAQKCMRYFMPHQKCLMNFTNLYNLVRLTSLQEYIDETERVLPQKQRTKMKSSPPLDWSLWNQFQKDAGPNFKQGLGNTEKTTPLWKRFPDDTEPVLLTFSTELPREDEPGLLLRFAYVVDQDGMVLGVESNTLFRELKDKAEGRVREQSSDEEETEPGPTLKLEFYVVPSITHKISVKAMYAKDPTSPDVKGDGSDDLLKESPIANVGGNI